MAINSTAAIIESEFSAIEPDIIDDYEHEDSTIEYILENILYDPVNDAADIDDNEDSEYKLLKEQYNSVLLSECNCCITSDCQNCAHGGNYICCIGKNNELVLNFTQEQSDLIYECTNRCKCKIKNCFNRLVQFGPRKNLQIIKSKQYKSYGLITLVQIPKGAFICEYAGELLTCKEAFRRAKENERTGAMNYILCLNEISKNYSANCQRHMTIVDPSSKGNIGRYMNHSCDPNCEIYSVRIDCPIPKICVFAKRDINVNEELCFHYAAGQRDCSTSQKLQLTPCLCEAPNCKKYLPFNEF